MMEKNKKAEIIDKIKERGYEIVEQKDVTFTEEMAKEFYKHQEQSVILNLKFIINYIVNRRRNI